MAQTHDPYAKRSETDPDRIIGSNVFVAWSHLHTT